MLVVQLLLGAFEAGFFADLLFYLMLFCTRVESGFRIAVFSSRALLAGASSGLVLFGVSQIYHALETGVRYRK